jgi:hypothetical protein
MDTAMSRADQLRQHLYRVGSFERAAVLFDYLEAGMNQPDQLEVWLQVVGEFWEMLDGDRQMLVIVLGVYRERLGEARFWPLLMTAEERAHLAGMPDEFEVFRGCYARVNTGGCSWSLDEATAEKFPLLHRYRIPNRQPVLLKATARRDDCALKLGRGEDEVITLTPRRVKKLRVLNGPPK